MNKRISLVQVVQIGNRRYGPGRARQAACEYAHTIALDYHRKGNSFREWNEWHKVAFHRSLPYFERLLGPVKNRRNPRSLIELDLVNGTANVIDN